MYNFWFRKITRNFFYITPRFFFVPILSSNGATGMSELETVEKRIRETVNNLSLENIEECLEKIHNLQINSKSSFKTLVDVLHEKATTEPSNIAVYAQLCKRLVTVFDTGGTQVDFQKLLLNKSWKELEQGTQETLGTEDEDGKKISSKQVENVRFIKELFKLGVLIEPFMLECINQLFKQGDDESLKCLQRLKNIIHEKEKETRTVEKAFHSPPHFVDNQGVKSSKPTEVVSSLLTQKVKLQETENAQKTSQKMASSLSADIKELECDVRMQLNDIMKKLSLENFEVLEEIQSLHKDTEQAFNVLVHLILEKVTNEESSAFISAHLCKHLVYRNDGTNTSKPSFQEILLSKCRDELKLDKHFGKEHEDNLKVTHFDKKNEETENKEEKGTSLRHIRIFWFIIELLKLGVLTEPIILQYIDKLFTEGSEESLNCLFQLRTIIDRNLDEITTSNKFGKKPEYITLHKRLYEIYWNLSPNNILEHFEIIQSFHTESSFNLLVDVLHKRAKQDTPSTSQWAELSRCLGKRKEFEQKNEEQKITLRQIKNLGCFLDIFEMGMLTELIILLCIDKLFIQGSNESLKCLFRLWKKIDRKLDERMVVKKAGEVTAKNWITIRSENSPNTIDQTPRETEKEACEQQPLYQKNNCVPRSDENSSKTTDIWLTIHNYVFLGKKWRKMPEDSNIEAIHRRPPVSDSYLVSDLARLCTEMSIASQTVKACAQYFYSKSSHGLIRVCLPQTSLLPGAVWHSPVLPSDRSTVFQYRED
ncbi:eukaryotic translation initiation factor 4 gamma 3 [Trichonephila inaurata madagascariensis]|uniref:Eukaryotic translation initiation factor 4 gamma 3 n=1 Tax=Trichonephila inaurata madagascariensis TaxID=2747483 RepID=A0A8X6YXI7_9ARAC|nr:eukaryotic translation initiation factor 4 gamma 3 [Trichonephila inaurata madagascariensis]